MNELRRKQYNEYLNSNDWKQKRQDAFNFHGKKCMRCQNMLSLHVHHMTYRNFMNEHMEDLCILCTRCHDEYHLKNKVISIQTTTNFIKTRPVLLDKKAKVKRHKSTKKSINQLVRMKDKNLKKYLKKQDSKSRKEIIRQMDIYFKTGVLPKITTLY